MKKLFFTVVILLTVFNLSYSQVITVSNATNTPGQFSNLQTAIDSASPGDTIYVHGANYTTITVNKTLTFIGPGNNIQGQFTTMAWLPLIYLDNVVPTTTASGSKFIGLHIGYIAKKSSEQFQIDNITIERCRISTSLSSHVLGDNWIIRNNLFYWSGTGGSLELNNYNNILIANNIFHAPAGTFQIKLSNKSSVLITNNLFTGHYENSSQFQNISNATFSNNIFFGKSPQGVTSSIFEKNITYGNLSSNALPYGNNVGINNLVNMDPLFTLVAIDNLKYLFDYAFNYQLMATSPGKNAGTDGTDIGIFGGPFPMPLFNNLTLDGAPKLPQIYYMHIQNNVIDQNTPINVTVKARKRD
ncbi:MAG: right-handed parallel beta-helix repeat-containing protein [Bacteroidales bacterium]|nr:right-handed parallel beta-helix repeat-containing protein [Bacteroidales bacterium]